MIENIAAGITEQNRTSPLNHASLYQDVFCLIDLFEFAYQHCEVESASALESFFIAVNQCITDMAFRCLHDFRTRRCFKQCRAVVNDYVQNKTPEQPERLIRFFSAIAHLVQYGVKVFGIANILKNTRAFWNI